MKKWFFGLMYLVTGCLSVCAAEPAQVELKGIVQFPNSSELATVPGRQPSLVALIELHSQPLYRRDESALLGEGQRQGDLEVVKIDVPTGKVQVKVNGELRELSLALASIPKRTLRYQTGGQSASASSGGIRLRDATWRQALVIYQELVGRTLLRSSRLTQETRINLQMDAPASSEELAKGIEKALEGLVFHPDGDRFIVVGPEGDFEKLTPELRELARKLTTKAPTPPGAQGAEETSPKTDAPEEMIPAGMINFMDTDLNQVLMVFQELVNRTLLHSAAFPAPTISLKTQTPLTKGNAIYGICAVLALNGISLVDSGDKFLFGYPSLLETRRKAMFARKLPSHADVPDGAKLQMEIAQTSSPLELGALARAYGRLLGRPIELDQDLPSLHFSFRPQQPLTASEMLHAFDLLLAWEGLEVVKSKEGSELRVVRIAN